MVRRILLAFFALAILVVGAGWAFQLGLFQEQKTLSLRADKEAYVLYFCPPDQEICRNIGWNERANAEFKRRDLWPEDTQGLAGSRVIPAAQIEILNSIRFCLMGDTTPDYGVVIATDRGDVEGLDLIPLRQQEFGAGRIGLAPVWVQMQGLYRPCGWGGEKIFSDFLEQLF